jgi:hypothetical protein
MLCLLEVNVGPSTVSSALKCVAEDLLLRAKHVEEMDAQLQVADAMAEAVKKCADGLHEGFLNTKECAESLDLALSEYIKLRASDRLNQISGQRTREPLMTVRASSPESI